MSDDLRLKTLSAFSRTRKKYGDGVVICVVTSKAKSIMASVTMEKSSSTVILLEVYVP